MNMETPITRAHLDEAYKAQGEAYGRHERARKRLVERRHLARLVQRLVEEAEQDEAQFSADYDRADHRWAALQAAYEAQQARPVGAQTIPLLCLPSDPTPA